MVYRQGGKMQPFRSVQKDKISKSEALDLVLIIDRSGSMAGTERGIILGHQTLIDALEKTGKKDKNNPCPSADVLYLPYLRIISLAS